jgi:hypothetical protein
VRGQWREGGRQSAKGPQGHSDDLRGAACSCLLLPLSVAQLRLQLPLNPQEGCRPASLTPGVQGVQLPAPAAELVPGGQGSQVSMMVASR